MENFESRIITDETGYNYVKVKPEEVFKWGGYCICNSCNNQILDEDLNLVWACSDTYCNECFEDMRKRWKTYSKEDIEYDLALQKENALDWYRYHLDEEYRDKILEETKKYYEDINTKVINIDDIDTLFED